MSLDKAIKHKKEKRKPYRGGKAIDVNCRNHGNCDFCRKGRLHKTTKQKLQAQYAINDSLVLEIVDEQKVDNSNKL